MGTRAIVKFNGKKVVATHWDGDPENLGKLLVSFTKRKGIAKLSMPQMKKILDIKHTVDHTFKRGEII